MYRPGEVINPDPLGYSRMQSPFLFSFFFWVHAVWGTNEKRKKKNLNSSISQKTTLAGCQKT